MCNIRMVIRDGWDVFQFVDGGYVIGEYWVNQNSLTTLEDVVSEHNRATMLGCRYEQVSQVGERKAVLN